MEKFKATLIALVSFFSFKIYIQFKLQLKIKCIRIKNESLLFFTTIKCILFKVNFIINHHFERMNDRFIIVIVVIFLLQSQQ